MKYSVKIIIPFYKETLKDWEKAALANNMEKLSNYPVVFLKPEGLNISSYEQACPRHIGTSRERVIKTLKKLNDKKLIHKSKGCIELTNIDGL